MKNEIYVYGTKKEIERIIEDVEREGVKPFFEHKRNIKWRSKSGNFRLWVYNGYWSVCTAG